MFRNQISKPTDWQQTLCHQILNYYYYFSSPTIPTLTKREPQKGQEEFDFPKESNCNPVC